jgi:hypothetical protein
MVTQSTSYIIIALNFVMRLTFIALAEVIGFKTKSAKEDFVKTAVFYCSFFYTGLQILFATLNFRMFADEQIKSAGLYTDFNAHWFKDVGYIVVYNMTYNVFWPILEFGLYSGLRHLYRMWDQRKCWPSDVYRTRCTTI